MRNFIRHFRGSHRRKLENKWRKYKAEYDAVKDLVSSYIMTAIAPPEENIKDIKSFNEMEVKMKKWDIDRRIASIKAVKDLLSLAKESQYHFFHK